MIDRAFKHPATLILGILSFILVYSCNTDKLEYAKLEKYYQENTTLHSQTADSLMAFCKRNHTHVIVKKSDFKESAIAFQIHFDPGSTFYPVYYDSALNRHDPYPEKTLRYSIPFSIIKNFSRSIYNAASADSSQAFFAGKSHVKAQLGTQGDAQYGILVSADTTIARKCIIRLSPNACITMGTIP